MIKKILNNNFFKSILTLSTGSLFSQIITLISSPIMTRMYTPTEIGFFTLVLTGVNLFGGVIAGQYDMTIVYSKQDNEIKSLIQLSTIVTISSSLIISVLYSLYLKTTNDINLPLTIIFIFVLLVVSGLSLIVISLNNRKNNYKEISKSSVYQSSVNSSLIIVLGLLKSGSLGLLMSELIGRSISVIYLFKDYFKKSLFNIDINEIKSSATKYIKQPLFQVPALLANNFAYSSINIFINILFGTSVLGFYSISYRALGMPLNLISNNVSKVYLREASKEFENKGSYFKTFKRTSLFLIAVAIPMVIILMVFSPSIFELVFGDQWRVAGKFVQILAPMFGVRMIVSPLTSGIIISGGQRVNLIIQSLFILTASTIFLYAKVMKLAVVNYLILVSISYIGIYLIYYFMLFNFSKTRNNGKEEKINE